MNYIKHHKGVFAKMSKDKEITSIDISIYNALFLVWNYSNFCETLSISRSEIMELSKVGNANTYTKSLKRLHDKGYIIYIPSHNPLVGSKITMCKFDNTSDKSSDITSGKTSGYSADNTSDTLYKRYNKLTKEQIDYILTHFNSIDKNKIEIEIKKLKKDVPKKDTFIPPTIEEVKEYCLERKNNVNPNKFVDFYQSKNWMVGKNKMKDWKACVRTWETKDEPKKEYQPKKGFNFVVN